MTAPNPDPSHIRLAKRVAEQLNCSRSTAEQFIEGGFVSVDGQLEEAPGARVRPDQVVTVAPDASLLELTPVTLLLHKPVGFEAGLGLPQGSVQEWVQHAYDDVPPRMWPVAQRSLLAHVERIRALQPGNN